MTAPTPEVDFDLLAASSQESSNRLWAVARETAPVVRLVNQPGHWLVTRYNEVCAAFRDWEHFSSARTNPEQNAISVTQGTVPLLVPEEIDPPLWFPMRRVLAEILTPRAAEDRRSRIGYWCHRSLDRICASGQGDLVTDFVVPVPVSVTMEMLGFPEAVWMPIATVFHDVSAYPVGHPRRESAISRYPEVMALIRHQVELRRADPCEDAVSSIAHAEVDGELIDLEMAERLVFMVIAGGVDTTTAVSAAAFVHLGRDRDLRRRLSTDRSLLPSAMEEFLRMYPPARTHARTVKETVELAGCQLDVGERVVLSELSANYDERAFPEPKVFQVDRFPNRHVTFGMGIHRCAGSHLARVMFTEMLTAVLDRIPEYDLDEAGLVEYPSWTMVGGWAHIPVRFPPASHA